MEQGRRLGKQPKLPKWMSHFQVAACGSVHWKAGVVVSGSFITTSVIRANRQFLINEYKYNKTILFFSFPSAITPAWDPSSCSIIMSQKAPPDSFHQHHCAQFQSQIPS